jgi:hypothetical protein
MNFLQFSTQFKRISKSANTIEVILLRTDPRKFEMLTESPLVLRLGPQEDLGPSNVAPGRWPAQVGLNSGEARRSLAGEGRGEGLGVTGVWVLAEVKVGAALEVGRDGDQRRRARQLRSGKLSAGAGEWAVHTALQGPRGAAGGVNQQWRRVGRRRTRGGAPGAVVSAGPA